MTLTFSSVLNYDFLISWKKGLQGHDKFKVILDWGVKRAIFMRVKGTVA